MRLSIYSGILKVQWIWGYFIQMNPIKNLIGYADVGYLSNPHNGRSLTGYLFTYGGTAIS